MFLEHVYSQQEVDVNIVEDLQRALNLVLIVELEFARVDSAQDHACADSHGHTSKPGVDLIGQARLLGEGSAYDGALGAGIHEGLQLDALDLHVYVQHSGRYEALGQVLFGVLAIVRLIYSLALMFCWWMVRSISICFLTSCGEGLFTILLWLSYVVLLAPKLLPW